MEPTFSLLVQIKKAPDQQKVDIIGIHPQVYIELNPLQGNRVCPFCNKHKTLTTDFIQYEEKWERKAN